MAKKENSNKCRHCHRAKEPEEMRSKTVCHKCYNKKQSDRFSRFDVKPKPLFGDHFENQPFSWVF